MTKEPLADWPFGTKVEIGGRTMLRPGFSLVGLTGMVYLPSPNAPAGCQTVIVDWHSHGYTPEAGYPEGSLPMLVNVPREHLLIFEEKPEAPAPEEKKPFRPKLRGVDGVADAPAPILKDGEETLPTSKPAAPPTPAETKEEEKPKTERPKLRLV